MFIHQQPVAQRGEFGYDRFTFCNAVLADSRRRTYPPTPFLKEGGAKRRAVMAAGW